MSRPSLRLPLIVLLFGLLFFLAPPLERSEEIFLRWLVRNSAAPSVPVPLTIVEISDSHSLPAPTEVALFLQAALEFKPAVIAFEPVLKWTGNEKDEEQILIDQAMRVPKLLLGAELAPPPYTNEQRAEISGFDRISGSRDKLAKFSGVAWQPEDDLLLISTIGFINSENVRGNTQIPLLFGYRGEVIPSFALQAVLLWMRIAPSEVKIDIGTSIALPSGVKIPTRSNGTTLINPNAIRRACYVSLNELLFQAQQHESKTANATEFKRIQGQILLARTAPDSKASTDFVAATIAALQTNSVLRRASWLFDCAFILILAAVSGIAQRVSRVDLVLVAIALSAAYCLVALGVLSTRSVWLPGVLPIGNIWLVTFFCVFARRRYT
jgi:hypothetical protein